MCIESRLIFALFQYLHIFRYVPNSFFEKVYSGKIWPNLWWLGNISFVSNIPISQFHITSLPIFNSQICFFAFPVTLCIFKKALKIELYKLIKNIDTSKHLPTQSHIEYKPFFALFQYLHILRYLIHFLKSLFRKDMTNLWWLVKSSFISNFTHNNFNLYHISLIHNWWFPSFVKNSVHKILKWLKDNVPGY